MQTINKINWAILVTGWGRNAVDTLKAYANEKLGSGHRISLVLYESEPCGAAELAVNIGVETLQLKRKDFKDSEIYQKKIVEELQNRNIDYIFMLNYKYIIRKNMLSAFPSRIINIHPSLFPSFLGTKTAIQDALAYGVKITGITTHIIDDKVDEGEILCQVAIKVKDEDTFDTLYPKFSKKGAKLIIKTMKKVESLHINTVGNNE
ncbi:formyltransferase family protein [uncultured Aquimarina sp.]|uniref:formyltransferase family protein n=1 Tax=uncultured Aquimarina sp. TaxID=575652 RepID=UPI00262E7001|nr:formyltransferase family protein [uncultured Aquimarina sp.]